MTNPDMVEALSFFTGDRTSDTSSSLEPDVFSGFCFVATPLPNANAAGASSSTSNTPASTSTSSSSTTSTSSAVSPRSDVKVSGKDIISVCFHIIIQAVDGLPEALNNSPGMSARECSSILTNERLTD